MTREKEDEKALYHERELTLYDCETSRGQGRAACAWAQEKRFGWSISLSTNRVNPAATRFTARAIRFGAMRWR
jgi:hypothetical protein